jgi:hypothetical protein
MVLCHLYNIYVCVCVYMLCTYSVKIFFRCFFFPFSFLYLLLILLRLVGYLESMSGYFGNKFLGFRCMSIDVSCVLVAYLANHCFAALGVNRLIVWCS